MRGAASRTESAYGEQDGGWRPESIFGPRWRRSRRWDQSHGSGARSQSCEQAELRSRKRDDASRDELTPQELQVALVVAEGVTNREAGARLFLSPKTIEVHLSRAYQKARCAH